MTPTLIFQGQDDFIFWIEYSIELVQKCTICFSWQNSNVSAKMFKMTMTIKMTMPINIQVHFCLYRI